ncbi:ankyrin repeat domain-containing protein [Parachlamydia sp. AcF125]|uniref:ankyrin repeat domain-containing protein n=1 Tax=Parachlamydia sp. AcF125 TaxID=2795736 RepID=UPI001BC9BBD4|nr:ankyrin repeat domain-containing protein [Parachlamydia sp. AcF125]MBS4167421.1 hypothetical protein [Parachlamydia sp. AcF125]
MPNTDRLASGSSALELHAQLAALAKEVQTNKTISTNLRARKWDGRVWRWITNLLAIIGIKFERTHSIHVAKKLKRFVEKNEALFDKAYKADNLENLKTLFKRVLWIDRSSNKSTRSKSYTALYEEYLKFIQTKEHSEAGKPEESHSTSTISEKKREEYSPHSLGDSKQAENEKPFLERHEEATNSLEVKGDASKNVKEFLPKDPPKEDKPAEGDSTPTISEKTREEYSLHSLGDNKQAEKEKSYSERYVEALDVLAEKGYASEHVKEFLKVVYPGKESLAEWAVKFREVPDLVEQLRKTVKNLSENTTKNARYPTAQRIENSHASRLRHILTIAVALPFNEKIEALIGQVATYPVDAVRKHDVQKILYKVAETAIRLKNRPFFDFIFKKEIEKEEIEKFWQLILKYPHEFEDLEVEENRIVWKSAICSEATNRSLTRLPQSVFHVFARQEGFSKFAQKLGEKFLQQKPELLNFIEGFRQQSPLHTAAYANNYKMVVWLLSKNPELSLTNDEGQNALKIAHDKKHAKIVHALLAADPTKKTWQAAGLDK